jgi:hypothetical protein
MNDRLVASNPFYSLSIAILSLPVFPLPRIFEVNSHEATGAFSIRRVIASLQLKAPVRIGKLSR